MTSHETILTFTPRVPQLRWLGRYRSLVFGLGALLVAFTGINARAVDVSGSYEDYGVVISESKDPAYPAMSLRALLCLDFDAMPTRAPTSDVGHINITQTKQWLQVEMVDEDGKSVWNERWQKDEGCYFKDVGVVLALHTPRKGSDQYVLTLRPAEGQPALLVDVQVVSKAVLGPLVRPTVTYLFARY